jgi:hypothetical protein
VEDGGEECGRIGVDGFMLPEIESFLDTEKRCLKLNVEKVDTGQMSFVVALVGARGFSTHSIARQGLFQKQF